MDKTNVVKLVYAPKDLIGTEVPYDVTKDDYLIGHHVLCKSIVPLENSPDYLVNGNHLLPAAILNKCLELLATNAKAEAAVTRPQMTTWKPTKVRWYRRAYRYLKAAAGAFLASLKPKPKAFPGDK